MKRKKKIKNKKKKTNIRKKKHKKSAFKKKNYLKKKKNNKIKKKKTLKKRKNNKIKKKKTLKKRKKSQINKKSKLLLLKIIRFADKVKINFNFNLDAYLQKIFQGISNKINDKIESVRSIIEEEKERKKQYLIKRMHSEKIEKIKKLNYEKQLSLESKEQEYREEIKLERQRKKELQKYIRLEQAEVRKEQADKQRKFLAQIKLEKKIDQFRKREEIEIKNIEKLVLSLERDSYEEVQERIEKIKQKYQALRDQKIRERVEQLGVKVEEGDDRSALLAKERQYNLERQKIEFALESFYRSAHSLCFQINKKYIPKYLSIMRVIDRRFETGEIFIKWDEAPDEEWLILIYIKNNSPDEGIIIEDKTDPEKNVSHEFNSNEIFRASDTMVDALTKLLDKERNKRKAIQ